MDTRIALSDSNDTSGGSSTTCYITAVTETSSQGESTPDVAALRRLSENLESVFEASDFDSFSDAKIVVSPDQEVAVHRCVLASRSPFFRKVFCNRDEVKIELRELTKELSVGYDALVAVLSYMYCGKVKPLLSLCVCVDDDCDHIACRPCLDFFLEALYASYTFQIAELVALYQGHLVEIIDKVDVDDVLAVLRLAHICAGSCERLQSRCIDIIVKSNIDSVKIEKELPHYIAKQVMNLRFEGSETSGGSTTDKHIKRVHKALESDDVELVRMLLKEGHTTLDDSCALHYAVAYCDAKTTTELLDLGLADVNRRNSRGQTVLHIAAMRKEPQIIVSLLTKGARASDLTPDGRKAVEISRRVTRAVDYCKPREEGKPTPKDRLCIEILEQAESRDPLLGEASVSLAMAGDDLRMKLLYLENRVGLAKLLFPVEAKVAMDIAQVDGTSEFPLADVSPKKMSGGSTVDLNEAPFLMKEEHLSRMRVLSKTVEVGKHFFPRCSEVLNKIMDAEDLSELASLSKDTTEERIVKKRRYVELQYALMKAFDEDKEDFDKSGLSSSSSTSIVTKAKNLPNQAKITRRNT